MSQVLAIVTTSGGARGISNTFTRNLAGTPLIAHTLKECEKSQRITRTIVSTDSKEVARAVGLYSAKVIIRPGDITKLIQVLKHALEELRNTEECEPDVVVALPGQFPLRKSEEIDDAILKFENTGSDSVLSICPIEHASEEILSLDGDKVISLISDADKRTIYRSNGAIYVFKPSQIQQGRLIGNDSRAIIMKAADSVSADNHYGFMKAESILKDRKKNIFR